MNKFSALAAPIRRNIMEILANAGRLSVAEICEKFNVTPSAISQHLKVLRAAKLVRVEKQGQQRIYAIEPDALRELEGWAVHVRQRFDALDNLLEQEQQKLRHSTLRTEKSSMAQHHPTQIAVEPGKQELFISREFDAPPELVFKAHTEAELYKQWLGPKNLVMRLERFEPQTGGSYRYVHTDNNGNEYGFHGVFHEVTAPERIVQTFEFEGMPERGHVSLETLNLEALPGGRTKLTAHAVFQSVEDRDGMVNSGMEHGVNDGYERLDDLLERMRKTEAAAGA